MRFLMPLKLLHWHILHVSSGEIQTKAPEGGETKKRFCLKISEIEFIMESVLNLSS